MSISVAIASIDKDLYLARTIESVYSWVDEIVLVYCSPRDALVDDVMSHDPEKKIKLTLSENHPMFHKNKQLALDKCTSDWILQLDSDEVVTPALRDEIQSTISQPTDHNGYWMPRLNHFLGKPLRKGGQYPDKTIRLYKRGKAHLPCKSLHEQAEVVGSVGELSNNLLHFPYPTFATYLRKWVTYGAQEIDPKEMRSLHLGPWSAFQYFVVKPKMWFLMTFFRHRGYVDGFPGFAFSLFSALRYWLIYIALWERKHTRS